MPKPIDGNRWGYVGVWRSRTACSILVRNVRASEGPLPCPELCYASHVHMPPGSAMLVGKVPLPALSSTRLGVLEFPSSTSRSPSPSTSAAAIEFVDDVMLPPGSTRSRK